MSPVVDDAMPFIVALAIAIVVEFVGGALTRLDSWYAALKKPPWQPPGWAFAPAWTVLFILIGVSAGLAWQAAAESARPAVVAAFLVNAVFNMAWSGLFFTLRRPDWAFYEVLPFWVSIAALIAVVWPVSQTAGLLLLPYLAWVAFAAFLNWTVARLNAYL